jgi:hypothetical protein
MRRLFLATCILAVLAFLGLYYEYSTGTPAYAQTNETSTTPDCQFSATLTGATASAAIPNSSATAGTPCVFWRLTYTPNGFTALSLAFQGARDSSGSAGTFSDIPAGNILEGSNPLTDAVCQPGGTGCTMVARIYTPWVRVNVSTVTGTGTILLRAFGYRGTNPAATSSGTIAANVNLTGINGTTPVTEGAGLLAVSPTGSAVAQADGRTNTPNVPQVGVGGTPSTATMPSFPFKFNASTWDRDFICASQVETALVSTAYTAIVAASGSTVIRVCKLFVTSGSGGAPVVNTFTVAFGANCAMAPTEILSAVGVTGLDSDFQGSLRGAASAALCVKEATANTDKVTVTYAQY